jgi:hypothetical protein
LPRLALNFDPPDVSFLNSWDYRRESPAPDWLLISEGYILRSPWHPKGLREHSWGRYTVLEQVGRVKNGKQDTPLSHTPQLVTMKGNRC